MNKIVLIGRLTKDAELGMIPSTSTPKMRYTIAVDRSYQKDKNNKKVDFFNCEAIGKHCENLSKYVTKGKLVAVEGELNIDNYEKDGERKSYVKVNVERLEFLGGSKKDDDNKSFVPHFEPPKGFNSNSFQEIEDDDELPF